jgi:hypothetical protein
LDPYKIFIWNLQIGCKNQIGKPFRKGKRLAASKLAQQPNTQRGHARAKAAHRGPRPGSPHALDIFVKRYSRFRLIE